VKVLSKHMDLNIEDASVEPLLHYVYSLNQQDAREKILSILIPKLKSSFDNLSVAAKHGDLENTKHFVRTLSPRDRQFVSLAGIGAVKNEREDVLKWLIETPGIINWDADGSTLVGEAVSHKNLSLIEPLSTHFPGFPLHRLGYNTSSELCSFLQQVN